MKLRTGKWLKRILIAVVIIYVLGGIALYWFQDLFFFHPVPLPKDHRFSFDQAFTELNLPYGKDNLNIVQFKTTTKRKGIVLFFHGNAMNVEHYAKYPSLFIRSGYELWMIDYPGFGKTTGKRTEEIMYDQALKMYELAMQQTNPDSIIIYGKSMGTAVASWLASKRKSKSLILETPFYSVQALVRHYVPLYSFIPLSKYSFPNFEYLEKVKVPVTIFHGTNDQLVPYSQGKKLAQENNCRFITIEKGTHNDLFDFELYQREMDSLLK
jgi:pimeloyl-ACP methyl ester carboxylesterase